MLAVILPAFRLFWYWLAAMLCPAWLMLASFCRRNSKPRPLTAHASIPSQRLITHTQEDSKWQSKVSGWPCVNHSQLLGITSKLKELSFLSACMPLGNSPVPTLPAFSALMHMVNMRWGTFQFSPTKTSASLYKTCDTHRTAVVHCPRLAQMTCWRGAVRLTMHSSMNSS